MKKETIKNILIVLLIIVIIIMFVIGLSKSNNNSKINEIIKTSLNVQLNISEYIGKMKSDTFDTYTTEQLLIGSTDVQNIDTTRIKNNDDESLVQIVSIENKISQSDSTFYKINTDNFKTKFNVKLSEEDGITWYISNTGDIKVSYTSRPSWWTQDLDTLYIGK